MYFDDYDKSHKCVKLPFMLNPCIRCGCSIAKLGWNYNKRDRRYFMWLECIKCSEQIKTQKFYELGNTEDELSIDEQCEIIGDIIDYNRQPFSNLVDIWNTCYYASVGKSI